MLNDYQKWSVLGDHHQLAVCATEELRAKRATILAGHVMMRVLRSLSLVMDIDLGFRI